MIFGKIEYLNLLPFHVFMKRFTKSSSQKISMHYKKGVPAKINKEFMARRVDAAFISSINSKRFNNVGLGIIAKKDVQSVLVVPNERYKRDRESATSNILARILKLQGEVLIGDKALRYYLSKKEHIDLAEVWSDKFNLPFVFAVLCYHKDKKRYETIEREFLKTKVKIPQYILKQASKNTSIAGSDILEYLEHISYELDHKAKLGLKLFFKKSTSA